jgi:putative peptide zinc metalloprotease protein
MRIPQLKPGITLCPYEAMPGNEAPRFLLAHGDSYFLVSAKARALVAALMRAPATSDELEQHYAAESGQKLPAATLLALAEKTLPPLLFIDTPAPPRVLPFIVSIVLLGPRLATRISGRLTWLFKPQLAVFLLAAFALLHLAILPDAIRLSHSDWSAREAVALAGFFMLSGLVHELGHTSACRYFDCPHGGIGFGLYFIFPAWFADVTKAWQLQRRQRAVVDLGGVYFQSIFLIVVDAYALATASPIALKLAWAITFAMLFTLNPVFKFDGYWLLSDLSGLHNLHKQVRTSVAALFSALIGKRAASTPTASHSLLYAYSLLSACYFTYFGLFLAGELATFPATLMPKLSAAWSVLALASGEWETAVAAASVLGALAWPLVVVLAAVFFLKRLGHATAGIASSVHEARELRARSRPA